jgi:hypothetical protein
MTALDRLARFERFAEERMGVPPVVEASPVGNPDWCRDFDRYARELAKTPVPDTFGFSVRAGRAA